MKTLFKQTASKHLHVLFPMILLLGTSSYGKNGGAASADYSATAAAARVGIPSSAKLYEPVTITPSSSSLELALGTSKELILSQAVKWASTNDGIAFVPPFADSSDPSNPHKYSLVAFALGTATITATSEADPTQTATITVTVTPVIDRVAITNILLPLQVGATGNLAASVEPSDASQTVMWSSDKENIAPVDASTGVVTAMSTGEATITATSASDPSKTAAITVTVKPARPSVSKPVTVTPRSLSVTINEPEDLTANQEVEWKSDNESIAVVVFYPQRSLVIGTVYGMSAGTATITATSKADPSKSTSITVTVTSADAFVANNGKNQQAPVSRPFITIWKTRQNNERITIPTGDLSDGKSYNYSVDWGDQKKSTGRTRDASHVYAKAGEYIVTITGTFPRIYFNGNNDYKPGGDDDARRANAEKIKQVKQWGTQKWTSMAGAFCGCLYLTVTASDHPDLSLVTDMSRMFKYSGLEGGHQSINDWDVSHVVNMSEVFLGVMFHEEQPLSRWNVSNVENMSGMFYQSTFNSDISSWNVHKVTDMSRMFYESGFGYEKYDEEYNPVAVTWSIGDWNVSKVKNMSEMFAITAFNQDISDWKVNSVTHMSGMFNNTYKFNVDISGWNVSKVTDMSNMFGSATVFDQPLNSWNVANVTNMESMFQGAQAFDRPLNNWNMESVTNMSSMFKYMETFNQDLSAWNVHKVESMSSMFANTSAFNTDISGWNVSKVTDMSKILKEAKAFSAPHYANLLIAWAKLKVQSGVKFGVPPVKYCDNQEAVTAAQALKGKGWTFEDEAPCEAIGTVTITPSVLKLKVGATGSLTAIVTRTDGASVNQTVKWSSGNVAIATVDASSGLVTAVNAGTVVITATSTALPSVSNTVSVKVEVVVPESITIKPSELYLKMGETARRLTVSTTPSEATKVVRWSSLKENIAKVDRWGSVTPVAPGTTTITATSKVNAKATATVKVNVVAADAHIAVSGVSITNKEGFKDLNVNDVKNLRGEATVLPQEANNKAVVWESSNEEVVQVQSIAEGLRNKMIKAVSEGTAKLTVTTEEGEFQDFVMITVKGEDEEQEETVVDPKISKPVPGVGTADKGVIKITPTPLRLVKGEFKDLTANQEVTLTSKNESIVNIFFADTPKSKFKVLGKGQGTTIITATSTADPKVTATVEVTVTPAVIITPAALSLKVGATGNLTASVQPIGAPQGVEWSSDKKNIATVDANSGVVTAVAAGTAKVTATSTTDRLKLKKNSITVTVVPAVTSVAVTNITLAPKTLNLQICKTKDLTVAVTPKSATNKNVKWKSSNKKIATVDASGKVTGVAPGTATITAISQATPWITATTAVTVVKSDKHVPLLGITIDQKSPLNMEAEERKQLTITFNPCDASNKKVTWESSNKKLALVFRETGLVATRRVALEGTTTITATAEDGRHKATIIVQVRAATSGTNTGSNSIASTINNKLTLCEGANVRALENRIAVDKSVDPTDLKVYSAASGGNPLSPHISLVDGRAYYYSQVMGLKEGEREAVQVLFHQAPEIKKVIQIFCRGAKVSDLKISVAQGVEFFVTDTRYSKYPLKPNTELRYGSYYASLKVCPDVEKSSRISVRLLSKEDDAKANFYYGMKPDADSIAYAQSDSNPAAIIEINGGTFSSVPEGLTINPNTGYVDLSASQVGDYTITYTTPRKQCPAYKNFKFTITPPAPLNLETHQKENTLHVSPIPTTRRLTVHMENTTTGSLTLRLSTLLGNVVWQRTDQKTGEVWKQSLDLGDLSQGIYMLEIITDRQHWTRKVVKE